MTRPEVLFQVGAGAGRSYRHAGCVALDIYVSLDHGLWWFVATLMHAPKVAAFGRRLPLQGCHAPPSVRAHPAYR